MMTLHTILALSVFLAEGYFLLRLVLGKHSVLSLIEYSAYGFLLGSAFSAYATFGAALLGLPLSLMGLFALHAIMITILAVVTFLRFGTVLLSKIPLLPPPAFAEQKPPRWVKIFLAILALWVLVKILVGTYGLLATPVYYNDTYANWNMRAKAFSTHESLMLDRMPTDEFYFGGRVPSYPLTVYLSKVWIAKAAGGWNEGAVNSIHAVWFLALLAAFFAALRRETNLLWAAAGTYMLVSLPLLMLHGFSAYADALMAASLFATLYAFFRWVKSEGSLEREGWLRMFGMMTAAMVFVKNEAMLIFLPPLLLVFSLTCIRFGRLAINFRINDFSRWVGMLSIVALPWIFFKIAHGLTFGNATGVSGFSLVPQEGVAFAIEGDLLFTGSYLLLFPLLVLLLFLGFAEWRKHALKFLIIYLLIVFVGEFCIYALTPLSIEAIRHTGFGRGMVHLLPLCVFVCVLILGDIFNPVDHSVDRDSHRRL